MLARRRAAIVPGGATACWPLHRVPAAIVPLRPAVIRVAVNVTVGAGVNVAVRGAASTCRVAVAPLRYRSLGAGRGREPGRAAAGVGTAGRVHRLIRPGERARPRATVRARVLVGGAGHAGVGVVEAGVRRSPIGAPACRAVGVAACARIIGVEAGDAAIRTVYRATACPCAGCRVVGGAPSCCPAIWSVGISAPSPGAGRAAVDHAARVGRWVGVINRHRPGDDHRRVVIAGAVNEHPSRDEAHGVAGSVGVGHRRRRRDHDPDIGHRIQRIARRDGVDRRRHIGRQHKGPGRRYRNVPYALRTHVIPVGREDHAEG